MNRYLDARAVLAFQVVAFALVLILTLATHTGYLFDATNIFQIAGLSLVATIFLLSKEGARFVVGTNVLVLAATATVNFFVAGTGVAFYETLVVNGASSHPVVFGELVGALFLLAMIDLLVVGIAILLILLQPPSGGVHMAHDDSGSTAH